MSKKTAGTAPFKQKKHSGGKAPSPKVGPMSHTAPKMTKAKAPKSKVTTKMKSTDEVVAFRRAKYGI